MMLKLCGAKKRDGSGATCRNRAGWGTDHVGEGRCKLHSGAVPRGKKSPDYKHGLYSKHLTPEQTIAFDEFQKRLDWFKPSNEEAFILFRALELLTQPGTVPPLVAVTVLDKLSAVKQRYKHILEGLDVNIRLSDSETQQIIDATVTVLSKYVPDAHKDEALAEFTTLITADKP